jgi:hypothetical protein
MSREQAARLAAAGYLASRVVLRLFLIARRCLRALLQTEL